MTAATPEPTRTDDRPAPRRAGTAPVPLPVLVVGIVVVVAVVLGLASVGSWFAVAGIAVVLAGVIAVLVSWSDTW